MATKPTKQTEFYEALPGMMDARLIPREEPTLAEIEDARLRRTMVRNGVILLALLIVQLLLLVVLVRSTLSL